MTCYMRHMDWLFDALGLPSDTRQRRRVDAAIRVALGLPPDARCPEVWSAVKVLDDDGRSRLVVDVGRRLDAPHRPDRSVTVARARPADLPLLEPPDRAAWRDWLEANHASSRGIWLAVGKKGNSATALTYEEAVEEAVRFGWIDSTVNRLDDQRFKQLYTPRRPGSTWSRSNKERVDRLAAAGLMTPAGLAAVAAAKADGSWNQLDEVEDLVVPADLAAALDDGPQGAAASFGDLADSAKKQLLYWIASAKRPETRARRIAETVQAVAEGRMPR